MMQLNHRFAERTNHVSYRCVDVLELGEGTGTGMVLVQYRTVHCLAVLSPTRGEKDRAKRILFCSSHFRGSPKNGPFR